MVFREAGPWQKRLADDGIRCEFDSLDPPEIRRPLSTWRRLQRLVRLVRQERVELIHCNEHDYYPMLRRVARWTGVPILVHVRFKIDPAFSDWAFPPHSLPDAIQFTSRALEDACRPVLPESLGPDRLKLVMNGMDVEAFLARSHGGDSLRASWRLPADAIVIGTASSIRPHKRLEDFVEVIELLRVEHPQVVGVIAGGSPFADQDYVNKLENMIEERGLAGSVKMLGNLDPIAPFMQAIDIFASTSQWETFGMSICEAMASGKPAVAFDAGGVVEVIGDTNWIAEGRDKHLLVAMLSRLAKDSELRREAGTRGQQRVRERFDAAPHAQRQAKIYEQLVGSTLLTDSESPTAASTGTAF
jgi:glycosyltransferase involved in cell wall biosynthesis